MSVANRIDPALSADVTRRIHLSTTLAAPHFQRVRNLIEPAGPRSFFPGVDNGHASRDEGCGIARSYGESMYGRDCCNLTVGHGDKAASGSSATDQERIGHRSPLVER